MSQWASLYSRARKLIRPGALRASIPSDLGRLAALFLIAVAVTSALSDERAIADMIFQSPPSPVEQPAQPAEQPSQPAEQPPQPAEQPPVVESVSPVEATSPEELPQPAESQPVAPVQPEPVRPSRDERPEDLEEPSSSSNLILDQAELIDTIVVSTAYIWLCCGIILFLLIPLVFLFLQIRGRSKILREENF